ncbi:PPM-type phosphatase domain [Sesbania bispinosa]|nr:PPM-type phosphatase domain [Sesbania bispinosa]
MSSVSPTQDLSTDPSSESGNTSSSSFSSLLGDNPTLNTNQAPIVNIPDSEETESDSEDLSEGGRNIPPPKVYNTFLTETYNNNSEYTSFSSIERFRKSTPVANLTVEPSIVIDPCHKEELICLSSPDQGSSVPFTYIIPHKGILSAYTSSFKKWKQKFFKIRVSGVMSDLLVGEDGNPYFPLFWSLEPRRVPVVKFDKLPFDKKIDVAFLQNQAPIDCGFLLENEDLPARLRQSLDKMPPKTSVPQVITNEKALRRWLKKVGVDPNAPGSENQTTASANERRKKQKLDTPRDNQQQRTETKAMGTNLDVPPAKTTEGEGLTSDRSMPSSASHPQGNRPSPKPQTCGYTQNQTPVHTSSEPQGSMTSIPADKWWYLFNNFQGAEGSDITSIFDHRFPVEQVVGREFNKREDIARVNKVGMRNVGKHLMTMGMQTSFFGCCFDSAMNSVDKEMKDRALKIQDLTAKLQATESATQTIASLEKSLLEAKTKLATAESEKTAISTKCLEFETKYSDAFAEQVKLKKDFDDVVAAKVKLSQDLSDASEQNKQLANNLEALQKEVAILHAQGFHKAIEQVKLLNLEVNVEGVGVFKKIVDGKLVEESEDDEDLNHDSAAVGENLLPQPRTTTSPAFPSAAVGGSPLFTDATLAVKNITSSVLPRDRFHFLLFPFAHVEEPQSFEDEEPRLFPLCASKNPNRLTTKNPCAVLHCRALFSTKDPHSGDVPRVNGQLAVSRAFGDKSLKSHLRSDPDVQHTDIDADIDILILASDGLWKVMANQEAVEITTKLKHCTSASVHPWHGQVPIPYFGPPLSPLQVSSPGSIQPGETQSGTSQHPIITYRRRTQQVLPPTEDIIEDPSDSCPPPTASPITTLPKKNLLKIKPQGKIL